MTIPKEIYKAALGAACDHKAQPIVDDFMLGVEWMYDNHVHGTDQLQYCYDNLHQRYEERGDRYNALFKEHSYAVELISKIEKEVKILREKLKL